MPINTKDCYIEIGTSVNDDLTLNNSLELPAPIEIPSTNEFLVDAGRNANATMIVQQIGRTQYKTQIKWSALENRKWWAINRWFIEHGYVFYVKYFSHTDGQIKIHRFYRGGIESGVPSGVEIIDGYTVPKRYKNCGFSLIDMGEQDVIVVKEMR